MQEIRLLHFTGEDHPGQTAALAAVLTHYDARVLDLNQAVIHRTLLLGMMVRVRSDATDALIAELRDAAGQVNLALKTVVVPDAEYDAWVDSAGQPRHILSLLARSVTASHLAAVSELITHQGLNIDVITRVSGRPRRTLTSIDSANPQAGSSHLSSPLTGSQRACIEFSVRGEPRDAHKLRAEMMRLTHEHFIDLAWQRDDVFRRTRRLAAFDMDSTLIRHEVIDELAREAGKFAEVSAITEAAMRGEIDFRESLSRRVAHLKGLDASTFARVADRLELTEGAETLLRALRSYGYKTAILSGGFRYFGERLQATLGVDHVRTNDLEIVSGKLTGKLTGEIIDAPRKASLLGEIAAAEKIALQQTVAVGDGANDLPMLAAAGLGIAFHAKPLVARTARQSISHLGLDSILYLLGFRDRDLLEDANA